MSISCAETAGIFVANIWLAKHLIFCPASICQQWKQPWAQPCGISTENKCIIPSAFGKDYLSLPSCSQVRPNCQPFHSSGWEKHIPVQNLAARITRLLLPKMLRRHAVFYSQAMDNLLTALCIHEICQHRCLFPPTLLLNIRTGG